MAKTLTFEELVASYEAACARLAGGEPDAEAEVVRLEGLMAEQVDAAERGNRRSAAALSAQSRANAEAQRSAEVERLAAARERVASSAHAHLVVAERLEKAAAELKSALDAIAVSGAEVDAAAAECRTGAHGPMDFPTSRVSVHRWIGPWVLARLNSEHLGLPLPAAWASYRPPLLEQIRPVLEGVLAAAGTAMPVGDPEGVVK